MNDEHKKILRQKRAQEKKAILITILAVLVIALLILSAILFLPDRYDDTNENSELSSEQTGKDESNVVDNSLEVSNVSDISIDEVSNGNTSSEVSEVSSDNSDTTSGTDDIVHGWVINNLGYTYIYGDSGFEQFNATDTTMNRYATTINNLAKSLPDGVKIYSMLAPTYIEFVNIPREIYTADNFYNSSQKNTITKINDMLDDSITAINIYDKISSHSSEYLYFRTDINWTSLAAYYAYNDFASAAGFSQISLNEVSKQQYENYLGRFYSATNEDTLADNPDTIEYYLTDPNNACDLTIYHNGNTYSSYKVSGNSVTASANAYNIFLGMDAEYFKITTAASSGKKLLIVADTSAAPFVPYLVNAYSEIHYVNPNHFKENLSVFATGKDIDEVLFLSYTTNANRQAYTTVLSKLDGVS
ncbi:MAG: hypothetical protein A2Y15_08215 [Clostridiales bacterium GWF2_36_10]|nr:MAG: hypothetical protein A2Y15_08215 [Clostridiales bacterium GWF2_36_10]